MLPPKLLKPPHNRMPLLKPLKLHQPKPQPLHQPHHQPHQPLKPQLHQPHQPLKPQLPQLPHRHKNRQLLKKPKTKKRTRKKLMTMIKT